VSEATATREDEAAATSKGHVQRTRRRVPREVRIPQIARIAEDLFGQFGYQGTSMDDVARLAGISKPVVYDLVGSKEELFRLCMARSADELATRVASAVRGAPAHDRLRAGALAFFQFVDEHRPAWRGLLASGSSPLTAEMSQIRRRQASLVAGLLFEEDLDRERPREAEPIGKGPREEESVGKSEGGESEEKSLVDAGSSGTSPETSSGTSSRATSPVKDPVIVDALATAVNGAFEALAGWWPSHESMSAHDLADMMVQLVGPGLETFSCISGSIGAGR
jgi:AcrR family transcriptional regulator